jgi:hypothetical protein
VERLRCGDLERERPRPGRAAHVVRRGERRQEPVEQRDVARQAGRPRVTGRLPQRVEEQRQVPRAAAQGDEPHAGEATLVGERVALVERAARERQAGRIAERGQALGGGGRERAVRVGLERAPQQRDGGGALRHGREGPRRGGGDARVRVREVRRCHAERHLAARPQRAEHDGREVGVRVVEQAHERGADARARGQREPVGERRARLAGRLA